MNDTTLFAFESDFVATLRCVPMAVRFKLDACGIKLTLRQWSRFTLAHRHHLLQAPCEAEAEVAAYRDTLTEFIASRALGEVKTLAETPSPLWAQAERTPAAVRAFARSVSACAPSDAHWARLSPLQRFALLKLTRDSHDNVNFVPALQDVGLSTGRSAARSSNSAATISGV